MFTFILIYLKSYNILFLDILQKPFIVILACKMYDTITAQTSICHSWRWTLKSKTCRRHQKINWSTWYTNKM